MPPRQPGSSDSRKIRIESTNAEPLASLALYKVAVNLGERRYLIPALDAATWLQVLLAEEFDAEAIFPGFCGPAIISEVNQLLLGEEVTMEQMERAILDTIEAVSGRKWWITMQLCAWLRANWDRVGGELASYGVTPFGISLSYWLDGAYATSLRLIRDADPANLTPFTTWLTQPPPGRAVENFDLDRNQAAFKAAMAQARGR